MTHPVLPIFTLNRKVAVLALFGGLVSSATAAEPRNGQQTFLSTCAGCHGLDGRGGEHAPNIATNVQVQRLSDTELKQIISGGIPSAGMPGFKSSLDQNQISSIVVYLRTLQDQEAARSVAMAGNPDNGRKLFFGSARCSECHIVQNSGGFLGSDLSGYGETHNASVIRQSILNPNRDRNPSQGSIRVTTQSRETLTGAIRNEDNFSLQMQTPDGAFHLFDKADLASIDRSADSAIHSLLHLNSTELDDVVAYLSEQRSGKHSSESAGDQ